MHFYERHAALFESSWITDNVLCQPSGPSASAYVVLMVISSAFPLPPVSSLKGAINDILSDMCINYFCGKDQEDIVPVGWGG